MMSDINIWINDQQVKAKAGQTILQAADEAGIFIPRLCFHPALEPSGSCRLCAVEIDGQRGLPAACTTPVAEGMRIRTESSKLSDFRREMLQLILRDHPRHCLGCPRNGTCELQQLVAAVGIDFPYPPPDKERPEPLPGGAYFERDYSLCIRCGRCIRVCHEVRGARAIVFRESKDGRQEVSTPFGRPLEESGCQFCGACVDACPVGALRENLGDFQGEAVGQIQALCDALTAIVTDLYKKELETQWSTTLCPVCGAGCRLMVEKTEDEAIVRIKPSPDGPSNKGQACVQGRFLLKRYIQRPERLTSPQALENGSYKPVGWDEALDRLGQELKSRPASEIAFLTDGRLTNEELYGLARLAKEGVKTDRLGVLVPPAQYAFERVILENLGTAALTNSLDDLPESPALFAFGLNPAASHPIAGTRIREAVLKGAKLVVANPFDVAIARYAHVHLRYVPGSELALVLGLLRMILDEGGAVKDLPAEALAQLREATAPYDLDTVSRLSGIHPEELLEAGAALIPLDPVAVLVGTGVFGAHQSEDLARALLALAQVKGSFGRRGGGFRALYGAANVQSAREFGWSADVLSAIDSGAVKALVVASETVHPELWDILAPLADKLDFLAVCDVVPPPDSVRPHVLLPLASVLEKEGSMTNTERRVQWTERALESPGDARTALDVARGLAERLGSPDFSETNSGEVLERIAAEVSSYGGIHRSRARFETSFIPCPAEDHPGTPVLFESAPPSLQPWSPPAPPAAPEDGEKADEYPFRLVSKEALLPSYDGPLLAPEVRSIFSSEGEIEMNPADAYRLECMPGDTVAVVTDAGEITGPLALNIHLPLKLVAVTAEQLARVGGSSVSPGASLAAKVEKR